MRFSRQLRHGYFRIFSQVFSKYSYEFASDADDRFGRLVSEVSVREASLFEHKSIIEMLKLPDGIVVNPIGPALNPWPSRGAIKRLICAVSAYDATT